MTLRVRFCAKMYYKHLLLASAVAALIRSVGTFSIFDFKINFSGYDDLKINNNEDDADLDIKQLARKYNYNIEEHYVITEDGYKLTIHRFGNHTKNSIPIMLMHGVLESADSWILQGPSNSLGHTLVEHGFDVWLGNARGTKHSLSHVELSVTDVKFWNFTWEEIGLYDLPATIDYILDVTELNDLYYIGHSQGTTSFFVMNALKPEYNKKIKMMFAMAPVAWMTNIESPIIRFISDSIITYSLYFNIYSSSMEFLQWISYMSGICGTFLLNCRDMLPTFIGADNGLIEQKFLPVIFGHFPSSCSTLQLIHFGQLIHSGRFCRFDHGAKNVLEYGTTLPPDYNLSNVTVPIVLFYSYNDKLSHPMDVKTLYENLPNVYEVYNINNFNHIDYLYATNAKYSVYAEILNNVRKFENANNVIVN